MVEGSVAETATMVASSRRPRRRAAAVFTRSWSPVAIDTLRVGGSLFICGLIVWLDASTDSDVVEACMLPAVLLPMYPVGRRWTLLAAVAIAFAGVALGAFLEPPGESPETVLGNRGMAGIMIAVIGLLLDQVGRRERELTRLAATDPLTGAFNRRFGVELMTREIKRAERYRSGFAVVVLDIDHFKKLNDTHGHGAGDQALKAMTKTASRGLRPSDAVCRFGGEEFVVVLPHSDEAGALRVAERIRTTVEEERVVSGDATIRMTVSLGVATYVAGATFEELLECADKALYAAKEGGRNRTRIGHLVPSDGKLAPHVLEEGVSAIGDGGEGRRGSSTALLARARART